MFEGYLRVVVGAIVWTLANAVYFDLRRKGIRGFGRFAAFWAGNPATWLTLFLVKEGQVVQMEPPPDDEDRLLREVRIDRELRVRRAPMLETRNEGTAGETPAS